MAYSEKKKVYVIMRGAFNKKSFDEFLKNLTSSKAGFIQFNKEIKLRTVKPWDG